MIKKSMWLFVLVLVLAPGPAPAGAPAKTAPALEAMKSLAGFWKGQNNAGVPSRTKFELIAGGTAIVETTDFEAHPGESMVTVYHTDGDDVILTHYCIAGNQPRMKLAGWEPESQSLRFTFLDGANIPNRDVGHMDSAIFKLTDQDHFTTTWSWYQDGKEKWMEELTYARVRD